MGRNDALPDVTVLLEDRRWACALARSLVHDEHLADDIVQSAYLATLDNPPPAHVSLRAWFGGVVRNLSRMSLRSAKRARRRELAVERTEAAPSAADLVARAEQHHRLTALLLELEEPYRSAIVMRYFGGMEPAAIAARTGEPAATVRSRLKRGLQKLRDRLQASEGTSWRSLLLPLAVAPGAAVRGGTAAAASLTVAKVAVAVVVLLSIGTAAWRTLAPGGKAAATGPPAQAGLPDADAGKVAAIDPPRRLAPSRFVEPATGRVTGRVIDAAGAPVAGAAVIVFPNDLDRTIAASRPGEPASSGITDENGRFEIAPKTGSALVNVYAESPGSSPAVLESRSKAGELTLVLDRGSVMAGRVSDAKGAPLAGARVRWHASICGVSIAREAATGADGAYRMSGILADAQGVSTSLPPRIEVVVTAGGHAPAYLTPPPADESGSIRLDAVLVPGLEIRGSVVDAVTSLPLAGARVAFWTQREHTTAPGPSGRSLPDPMPVEGLAETASGTDGRFGLSGLSVPLASGEAPSSPGESFGVLAATAPGYSAAIQNVRLVLDGTRPEVVLACHRSGTLLGRLVDAEGRALPGVPVWLEPRVETHTAVPDGFDAERNRTVTDDEGRFTFGSVRIDAEDSATVDVVARPAAVLGPPFRRTDVVVRPGETTDLGAVPVRTVAALAVAVADRNGAPIPDARVSLAPFVDGEDLEGQSVPTDARGRAIIRCLEPAPGAASRIGRVFARHPGYARGSAFPEQAPPGQDLRIVLVPECVLRGRVSNDEGAPVLDAQVWLVDARVPREQAFVRATELEGAFQLLPPKYAAFTTTRAGGRFLMRGLAVNRFHVAVKRAEDWDRDYTVVYDVEIGPDELLIEIPARRADAAPCELEVAIRDAGTSQPVFGARAVLVSEDGADHPSRSTMGVHRFAGLPEGVHTLTIQARGYVERAIPGVELRRGEGRSIEIELVRGVSVRGLVSRADGVPFAGARIALFADDPIMPPFTALVGEDGRFVFEGLDRAREYAVAVVEPAPLGIGVFTPPGRRKVRLPDDPRKTELRIQVVPGGLAQFKLTGAPGLLRNARLAVANEAGARIYERTFLYKNVVPVSLPPGSYRASLVRADGAIEERPFRISEGDLIEVELPLR